VAPGGSLVLAIYKQTHHTTCVKTIKWGYNQVSGTIQHAVAFLFAAFIRLRIFSHSERGMDFWLHEIDWVRAHTNARRGPEAEELYMIKDSRCNNILRPGYQPVAVNSPFAGSQHENCLFY
jgi:hypothetical protein